MVSVVRLSLLTVLAWSALSLADAADDPLLTVAEQSGFQATARYDEVMDLARGIAAASPVARLDELGVTAEGRSIPLLWLADPLPAADGFAADDDRLVVLLLGSIHGGEICGKAALMMLARELATTADHPLLDRLAIAVVPVYNADGADRIAQENRPGQVGPADGTGERRNGQDLDLNRDNVKLEAPETRALLRFTRRFDPALVIDTHTTNGSFHQLALTYDGPKNPAGDPRIIELVREEFLPEVGRRVEETTGYRTFFYGNFDAEHEGWYGYPDVPRFGTPYRGLRNRLSILTEAHAHASYEDRVRATHAFVGTSLELLAEQAAEVRELLEQVDRDTVDAGREPQADDLVALRSQPEPVEQPVTIPGFVEQEVDGKSRPTDQTRDYAVSYYGKFAPTLTVTRPYAYLMPATMTAAAELLRQHGIAVEVLREDLDLDVESYRVEGIQQPRRVFYGFEPQRVDATARSQTERVPAGTLLVRTAQPLGSLVVYLLEPLSDDGLHSYERLVQLREGEDYPVRRLPAAAPMTTRALPPAADEPPELRRLTLDTLLEREANFIGPAVSGLRWAADGTALIQRKDDALWRVDAASGRATPLGDAQAMMAAVAKLDDIAPATVQQALRGRGASFDPAGEALLLDTAEELFYVRLDGSAARRLTQGGGDEELARFSPDGRQVAFVRDFDLWVVNVERGEPRQLTRGGHGELRHGKATWLYYEELLNRDWQAFWWSPDSRRLVFLELDNADVPRFTLVDDIPAAQAVEVTAYPRPGESNPRVRVGMVDVEGGGPRWAGLDYDPEDLLITGVHWWPDGSRVMLYAQNRVQDRLDVLAWPTNRKPPERLFRETTRAWVGNGVVPAFFEDGSFLWSSERSGWRHFYHYDGAGKLLRQVTSGEWEVRSIEHLDEEAGRLYFMGTRDGLIAENLYSIRLDGSEQRRLTAARGSHRVNFSPGGDAFIDNWSSINRPTQVALRDHEGGLVRVLDSNPVWDLERFRIGEYELHQVPSDDATPIEVKLLRPHDFDPSRRYPVWLMTYAGPHFPQVTDRWSSFLFGWDQLLAASGFVVVYADPRSASGKGAINSWRCYRRLGVSELEDLERVADWLGAQPWIDGERIGISGGSYGGFMTAYALTHSQRFAAGIAMAAVTDWRNYDTIYTERYMGTPADNPEGYDRTSVIGAAEKLHGRLLVVHGTMDDNVHVQNAIQLARALQDAGKPFEMMLYPQSRHGIRGTHSRRLMYDFIQRTLGD